MPRLTRRVPSYRLHRPSGQAVVTLDGRDIYLGPHDTPESRAAYDRAIAEWLGNGRRLARPVRAGARPASGGDVSIAEVLVVFWRHAERHYRTPAGKPSSELANYRDSLRPLRRLYGTTSARDFSPLKLKAVRQAMIDSGLCRNTINQRIGRIVRVFKWATSEELVPVSTHQALKTVSGLQKGRTEARESEPVGPVPEAFVEAIRPHVAPQVWTMVQLQSLTGMRPGEVCLLRTGDLDTSGKVWVYTPPHHKMLYRGRDRRIFLGPRAQAILKPWLKTDLGAYMFSPAEAREARYAAMRAARKSKVPPSQRDRKKRGAKRRPGEHYSPRTYYHAIGYGCRKAGVPSWHPNQLRHNAATRLRKEFGVDATRAILGHTSPATTEIYAELDSTKAAEIMGLVG